MDTGMNKYIVKIYVISVAMIMDAFEAEFYFILFLK